MAHGKKYNEAVKLVDAKKTYSIADAIELVKKTSTTKFDGSVEVHFNLGIDPAKSDQSVRGTLTLPHSIGKTKRIAAFVDSTNEKAAEEAGADIVGGDALIAEIASSGKIAFDVAIATPNMMPKLAKVAKILGPKGLMPNPKSETVTTDVKKTIAELKKGKVSFKNDDTGNVHQMIGKVSLDSAKLLENLQALLENLRRSKPASSKGVFIKSCTLTSSMGPAVRVQV